MISCGGTANTHESDIYPWIDEEIELLREALADGVPVIGLCLGAQLLDAGGRRQRCTAATRPRSAGCEVATEPGRRLPTPCSAGVPETFMAMQWHHYACDLPPGAVELARNPTCLQAFRLGEAAWGTQFHIEVTRDILLELDAVGRAEELEQAGYTEERYLAELERHLDAHEAIGRGHGRALRRARRSARPQRRLRRRSRPVARRGLYSDRPRV